MGRCNMIPALLLLFSSYSHGTIIDDRLDYRKMNLSSIPSVKEGDTSSIKTLIFSQNAIEYLQESDFKILESFSNIRYLFLDNNKIREIYNTGFSRLPNLKHLDLSHNQLSSVSNELKDDLRKLSHLKYINLKRNPIGDFNNIYELMNAGIDVDFDGMSGVNRKRRLATGNDEVNKIDVHEILDHDDENKTITDKPRKAFVRDNKQPSTVTEEKNQLDAKFRNSIVFNFVAAGLVLLVLPVGMVFYYLINKNRSMYS